MTEQEKKMLADAKKMPIVYDDDSPELTDKMREALERTISERKRQGIMYA